jgi:hypothetical protein
MRPVFTDVYGQLQPLMSRNPTSILPASSVANGISCFLRFFGGVLGRGLGLTVTTSTVSLALSLDSPIRRAAGDPNTTLSPQYMKIADWLT